MLSILARQAAIRFGNAPKQSQLFKPLLIKRGQGNDVACEIVWAVVHFALDALHAVPYSLAIRSIVTALAGDSNMKSQVCPNCCPAGGALFDRISKTETECRGCGHVRASKLRVLPEDKAREALIDWLLAS